MENRDRGSCRDRSMGSRERQFIVGMGMIDSDNVYNMVETLDYYGARYMSDMPEVYSMLFVQKVSFLEIAGAFLYGAFTFICFSRVI